MILAIYNVALLLALVVASPFWLWQTFTTQKYRQGLLERLGWIKPLQGQNGLPLIWIHAVSVGEVLAISRLVKTLDADLPGYFVAVSTTTRTGQELAQQRFGQDRVFYCPLDLPWAVRACLLVRKPAMLVLAETEFWPNLLSACFRRSIPVVVVNARISDRSWPRYWRLRSLWQPFLSRLSAVLAQSDLDADRLSRLGCAPVSVAGNLKFDVQADKVTQATTLMRTASSALRLVIAGSTLQGEEAMLLAAWPEILKTDSQLAMVLAPRHPERFAAVASLLQASPFPWRKRSTMSTQALIPGEIVLLDSMGELASIDALASVAFVGGSLVPAGGHNPLEPAQFAVPIVMGEHYANFRGIVEAMLAVDSIAIVNPDNLAGTVASLLRDTESARRMGERAQTIFNGHGRSHTPRGNRDPNSSERKKRNMRRPWLMPLVPLYAAGASIRSALLPRQHLSWPVVSVGNLSMGGAGKTPFTIALAQLLVQQGLHPDVLSRGYGRTPSTASRVNPDGSAEEFGDEPLLIANRTKLPVYVAAKRFQAGKLAEEEFAQRGNGVHLLDDGFQHRQLVRQIDIVLVSSEDLADRMLPAGNLRESRSALRRAHVLAVQAEDEQAMEHLLRLSFDSQSNQPIWRYRRKMLLPEIPETLQAQPFLAFCGIARSEQFFSGLERNGFLLPARHAFPDHHRFTSAEMEGLRALAVSSGARAMVTTAKDLYRLGELAHTSAVPIYAADVRVVLEDEARVSEWLAHALRPFSVPQS